MSNWENSWKVYRDFLPSLTVWYSLPENSRNSIRAEITHACAEVMRVEGDDPLSTPAVKTAQAEMIGKIGGLLGCPVARDEAEKMLEGWAYYSADQERIQRNGKLFGPQIAQAVGDPVSHWWAEEYTRRIGWLAADALNKKAKAASAAAEKQTAEAETAARHEEIFRLIALMNQRYPYPGQEEAPEFAELKKEVKTALDGTAEGSPEREALLSAYKRMMYLPFHQEDKREKPPEDGSGADPTDILNIFR